MLVMSKVYLTPIEIWISPSKLFVFCLKPLLLKWCCRQHMPRFVTVFMNRKAACKLCMCRCVSEGWRVCLRRAYALDKRSIENISIHHSSSCVHSTLYIQILLIRGLMCKIANSPKLCSVMRNAILPIFWIKHTVGTDCHLVPASLSTQLIDLLN